jgi:hypothetical protein
MTLAGAGILGEIEENWSRELEQSRLAIGHLHRKQVPENVVESPT